MTGNVNRDFSQIRANLLICTVAATSALSATLHMLGLNTPDVSESLGVIKQCCTH